MQSTTPSARCRRPEPPATPNAVFSCPKCGQILGDIPPQGMLTAVCTDCRLQFQIVRGRVTAAEATVSGTQSERVVIALPGEKATKKAWLFASGIGAPTLILVAAATGVGVIGLGAGAVMFVGTGFALGRTFMPRVNVSPDERVRLSATQRMLAEKLELEEARARVVEGMDSRAAVNAMDGLEAPHIAASISELRDLEEQQRELGRQIAANAEVESLLRGNSGPSA